VGAFRDPLHWLGLRYKLALMFVGVCLLAFGVGGYLVSAEAQRALEREIHARLEFQARTYAGALDGELRSLSRQLEDFASDGYIRSHVLALLDPAGTDSARSREELLRHLRKNKLPLVAAFASLRVIDGQGHTLIDTASRPEAAGSPQKDGVGTTCSRLLPPLDAGGSPLLELSTPLRSLDGASMLGRIHAEVFTGVWISEVMRSQTIKLDEASGAELRLIDDGENVLGISRERLFQRTGDPALLRSGSGLELEPATSGVAPWVDEHQESFVRSFPISSNGWRAQVRLQPEDALAAVAGLQSRFLFLGGILALLSAALLYFPLRFLTQSLGRLRDSAARIQAGDFTTRVEVTTEDELGELAQAFNLMAAAVEERTRRTESTAQALGAANQRLSAVIDSMRDGLLLLDAEGVPVLHNRSAEPLMNLLQRSGVATSRHQCREGQENRAACQVCLFDVHIPPRSCVLEIEGGVFEVRSTRFAPDGRGGSGRVLVSRDISDRVAQDEREIHQERLAVLGEVAAVMAHELNNPLAAISMFNQMLATEIDRGSPLHENVAVIQRNVDTCKRTIRELLDYANNTSPEILEINVEAVLEDVVAFLRPVGQRSDVEIAIDLRADGAIVRGDEVQLRQIFVNLILNAIQACSGRPGRVLVRSRLDGEQVLVEVDDNGCGIPAEVQSHVFKPFFTTKPRGEGTGLGLPTARRIAEMHGGSLELASSSSAGTNFRVRLRRDLDRLG